jgi:hypothetical protein
MMAILLLLSLVLLIIISDRRHARRDFRPARSRTPALSKGTFQ